jgi:catechol 2,3-dioxygenase-like lactoylglutathione lyase family enzyme
MYSGIEHFAISAKDTARLARWYRDLLGFTVAYDNQKEPPTFFIRLGTGSLLELIPAGEAVRQGRKTNDPGMSHFALSVGDFERAQADLRAKGIELRDIREASRGVKVGYFDDPEGNLVQVIYRPEPL